MDHATLIKALSDATAIDAKTINSALGVLSDTITTNLSQGNVIALPGFGTLATTLHPETTVTDPVTRITTLNPPHITATFTPAANLKKHLTANQ